MLPLLKNRWLSVPSMVDCDRESAIGQGGREAGEERSARERHADGRLLERQTASISLPSLSLSRYSVPFVRTRLLAHCAHVGSGRRLVFTCFTDSTLLEQTITGDFAFL